MRNRKTVVVVGLGEVGRQTYVDMLKNDSTKRWNFIGVDKDKEKVRGLAGATTKMPKSADVYVICVWSTADIIKVLDDIKNADLISIESTIAPAALPLLSSHKHAHKLVAFPHRYNPNDPQHRVFNLTRVLGGIMPETTLNALSFYSQFMSPNHIFTSAFDIAVLSKVCENTYRYWEIALAQELKEACESRGVDFDVLRLAMNTKWNINVLEARDGIGGKCLPKDLSLYRQFFRQDVVGGVLEALNERYREKHD